MTAPAFGQGLEQQLKSEPAAALAKAAHELGDAKRGAIVFHQPYAACTKCHRVDGSTNGLGPDLTKLDPKPNDEELVAAVLTPSKTIRKGYEPITVLTVEGLQINGILIQQTDKEITLRDLSRDGQETTIPAKEIEAIQQGTKSAMPEGLANQLTSRQQFLDLLKYLTEIRDGGLPRAQELQPPPATYALQIPEYENHIDHAGLLNSLDQKALKRGEAIYQRLCINCHGTLDRPGSLPTSLRFGSGKFKNGSDPFTMYQTLTRGFGLMVPQTWMVPQQKYDVVHYIRETYLKPHNPSQYFAVTKSYLDSLPKGDTFGPVPRVIEPWVTMNYGSGLINTYEVGNQGENFAYKGIATRLDPGPGGISRGQAWMVFDHDTFRMAAAWTGKGFIDWNGIHFNGRHQIHPRITGDVIVQNPNGPGWANPETGSFEDDQRIIGRDGKRYGPLPQSWADYHGLYHHGDKRIISYRIGQTEILEMPGQMEDFISSADATNAPPKETDTPIVTRTFNIGPRDREMILLVATAPQESPSLKEFDRIVQFGATSEAKPIAQTREFDGASYAEVSKAEAFDMTDEDFTITARIKTKTGGTILAKTQPDSRWVPNGKTFFVRGGRLCYDIGWVGAVQSRQQINDGKWHDVALRWHHKNALAELFIDGKPAGQKQLRPKADVEKHVLRVGFTAPNFPGPQTFFEGQLAEVRFHQKAVTDAELKNPKQTAPLAHWKFNAPTNEGKVLDVGSQKHHGTWRANGSQPPQESIVAGLLQSVPGAKWETRGSKLCLKIPAGEESLRFVLWMTTAQPDQPIKQIADRLPAPKPADDLSRLTEGGPTQWPQKLETVPALGTTGGAFEVDVLTIPEANPWLAQVRLTGIDFYREGDRAVLTAWDGDVWLMSGLNQLDQPNPKLTWQRIGCGLFQPLGVKIVAGKIHITCRDQLVILHDENGDGETDFYECHNHDHQVTEHFHEFAMGLQTDEEGNFYYAKSARHALPAVVPHHGTLLKITKDGSQTEILATGFRAANGVCLNPDGTFVVTDQEGHWNPKNRINWVTKCGFYGNMYGYHDVTDSSDEAMQQPLCWITNSFDRSPAELLWVPQDTWGRLAGSLLNLSYGYGKVYVVPFEEVDGEKQGGLCELPIGSLPTGVMRGRFHPKDRQLYTCGMFAWAGSATKPGGLYRIRATGEPMHLPIGLHAKRDKIQITWTDPLDRETAIDPKQYALKTWDLKRTKNYGSKHYNEQPLEVTAATLSKDGRTLTLKTPDLKPTWGMEIRCRLKTEKGRELSRVIHNSVFNLGE